MTNNTNDNTDSELAANEAKAPVKRPQGYTAIKYETFKELEQSLLEDKERMMRKIDKWHKIKKEIGQSAEFRIMQQARGIKEDYSIESLLDNAPEPAKLTA